MSGVTTSKSRGVNHLRNWRSAIGNQRRRRWVHSGVTTRKSFRILIELWGIPLADVLGSPGITHAKSFAILIEAGRRGAIYAAVITITPVV